MICISSLDSHANLQSVGEHLVCRELHQALSKGDMGTCWQEPTTCKVSPGAQAAQTTQRHQSLSQRVELETGEKKMR